MRITIDGLSRGFWRAEAAPSISIRQEERLFLGKISKDRHDLTRPATLVPRLESGMKATCVSDILAQGESAVDVKLGVVGALHGVLRVLINEARGLVVEGCFCFLAPPFAKSPSLIVLSTIVVEGMRKLTILAVS